jgi:hypothetical protein
MRTTLTLDDDVAAMLARLRKTQNGNLKQLVNEALRRALPEMQRSKKSFARHQTRTVSLGRCLLSSLDDVAEALAVTEGENFR